MHNAKSHTAAPANPITGTRRRPAKARAAIKETPQPSNISVTATSVSTDRELADMKRGAAAASRLPPVSAIEIAHHVSGSMPRLRLPATNSSRLQNPVITAAMIYRLNWAGGEVCVSIRLPHRDSADASRRMPHRPAATPGPYADLGARTRTAPAQFAAACARPALAPV